MRVMVVGSGYIGKNFATYAATREFSVDMVDSREGWVQKDFAGYDSVIFAAGISHRKQTVENKHLYFAVNRDLALAVAEKAKKAKVRQFVYLSSMAVYGKKEGEISANTKTVPRNNDYYGASKLQAENALKNLQGSEFTVARIRPPMVYGENCSGKYAQLFKIANRLPIVPNNNNKRSMIYIDNLSEFLCKVIVCHAGGVFCPQNKKYGNTAELIKQIRRQHGKKTVIFGACVLLRLFMAILPPVKTAYGSLYYSKDISNLPDYNAYRNKM